jgi:hypothetical protein
MPKPINDDYNNILGYIKTTIPTTFYENPIDPIYDGQYNFEGYIYGYDSGWQLERSYNGGTTFTPRTSTYIYPFNPTARPAPPESTFGFNIRIPLPKCLPGETEFISTFTFELLSTVMYCKECDDVARKIEEIEFTISGRVNPNDIPEPKKPCPQVPGDR